MWSCWLLAGAQPEAHSHRSGASREEQEEGEGVQRLPTQHRPAVAGRDAGGDQEEVQEGEVQNIKFLPKNEQLLTKYSLCVSVTSCQAENILSMQLSCPFPVNAQAAPFAFFLAVGCGFCMSVGAYLYAK